MPKPTVIKPSFRVAIKAQVNDPSVLELYFLDYIQDTERFDWYSMEVETVSIVQDVIDQVRLFNPSTVNMIIDCLGGDCGKAITIYNYLRGQSFRVGVDIIGMAASSATVLAMAASKGKLRMARNGFFIIHRAWGGGEGNSEDLRAAADVIDRYTAQMVDIYAQRTGMSAEAINALIADGDHWMNGEEALAGKWVDALYNQPEPAIQVSARVKALQASDHRYKHIPQALLTPAESEEPGEAAPGNGGILQQLNSYFMDLKKVVQAALGVPAKEAGAAGEAGAPGAAAIPTPAAGAKPGEEAKPDPVAAAVQAAMQPVLTNFATGLQTELETEIKGIEPAVMAAVEKKYGATIQELQTANAKLLKENKDLQEEAAGAKGAETTGEGAGTEKRVIGKFHKAAVPQA